MVTFIRRYALVLPLFLGLVVIVPRLASAQFLCTGGLRDGQTCEGDDDCTGGGVCIIPLGVCEGSDADVEFCICPGSECAAEPVCTDEQGLGTCAAGVFATLCCDLADNCTNDATCISTQKLCIGGDLKGYPCVNNLNCPSSLCRSTGKYCLEGDNDSFGCVDNDDCPGGTCVGAVATPTIGAATATPRPSTPTPVRTNTRTSTPVVSVTPITPATVAPTATGTRVTAGPTTTRTPSRTPENTVQIPTNTLPPTRTPGEGRQFATTTTDVGTGGYALQLDLAPDDVVAFPVEGVVEINGQSFGFTRRRTSQILNLTAPGGLPFSVSAGTTVLVTGATPGPPPPGGVIYRNEQGGTCAIGAADIGSGSLLPLILGAALLIGARRSRRLD